MYFLYYKNILTRGQKAIVFIIHKKENFIVGHSRGVDFMDIRVGFAAGAPKSRLLLYLASKQKLDPSIYQIGTSYKWICLWRVGGLRQ